MHAFSRKKWAVKGGGGTRKEQENREVGRTSAVPGLAIPSPGLNDPRSSAFGSPHALNAKVSIFRRSTLKLFPHASSDVIEYPASAPSKSKRSDAAAHASNPAFVSRHRFLSTWLSIGSVECARTLSVAVKPAGAKLLNCCQGLCEEAPTTVC